MGRHVLCPPTLTNMLHPTSSEDQLYRIDSELCIINAGARSLAAAGGPKLLGVAALGCVSALASPCLSRVSTATQHTNATRPAGVAFRRRYREIATCSAAVPPTCLPGGYGQPSDSRYGVVGQPGVG